MFSLSGTIPVVNNWFVIRVTDFISAGLTNFNNSDEIPSKPQLILE